MAKKKKKAAGKSKKRAKSKKAKKPSRVKKLVRKMKKTVKKVVPGRKRKKRKQQDKGHTDKGGGGGGVSLDGIELDDPEGVAPRPLSVNVVTATGTMSVLLSDPLTPGNWKNVTRAWLGHAESPYAELDAQENQAFSTLKLTKGPPTPQALYGYAFSGEQLSLLD